MVNVFKVADMSERSNLPPVIVGYSSNLAKKKKRRGWGILLPNNIGLRRFFRALNYKLY